MIIENVDQRSRDYSDIATAFRPGHADYAYFAKYGVRDYRGGGRQSARETAARVAAGAIARKVLGEGVDRARRPGPDRPARGRPRALGLGRDRTQPVLVPGRGDGPGLGGASGGRSARPAPPPAPSSRSRRAGVPAGWGAPIYGKLDAELAGALMSINAAKGVEIGAGFAAAALSGEENADEMRLGNDGPRVPLQPRRRHPRRHLHRPAGDARVAFKPTSSILTPAPLDQRGRRGDRGAHHRAATTPASASAPARWSRR